MDKSKLLLTLTAGILAGWCGSYLVSLRSPALDQVEVRALDLLRAHYDDKIESSNKTVLLPGNLSAEESARLYTIVCAWNYAPALDELYNTVPLSTLWQYVLDDLRRTVDRSKVESHEMARLASAVYLFTKIAQIRAFVEPSTADVKSIVAPPPQMFEEMRNACIALIVSKSLGWQVWHWSSLDDNLAMAGAYLDGSAAREIVKHLNVGRNSLLSLRVLLMLRYMYAYGQLEASTTAVLLAKSLESHGDPQVSEMARRLTDGITRYGDGSLRFTYSDFWGMRSFEFGK